MPPGDDALAKYWQDSVAFTKSNPPVIDMRIQRALADTMHVLSSEPTEVIYEEEPNLTFRGPALWVIPLAARNSPNVIMYFHGGGFISHSNASHRKMCGHIAKATGAKLLMVDYRLAPEHVFPAAIEDAVDAYKWLLTNSYRPHHIATMGDSAGGNLCTSVVLKLRELDEPLPAAIVAISPLYDLESTSGTIDTNAETEALITRETLERTRGMAVPQDQWKNPLVHILDADPTDLPPIYLTAGNYEVLLDHATRFADKATRAGVDVELEVAPGMQHVYTAMAGRHEQADKSIDAIGKWLQKKFEK
jgi:monoterpene epsilon-lactone hydrolase